MGRKARFTEADFIRSALEILAEKGISHVTITAIAQKTGAPIGSVYHRFKSREILLANLWVELIESFQEGFIRQLQAGNIKKAAGYTLDWVRKHPNKARVFLLYRREQLVRGDWPEDLKERVARQMEDLNTHLKRFTAGFLGKASQQNLSRVVFCLIQVPMGAARDFLETGKPIPAYYDRFVWATCQAVLEPHLTD